MILARRAIPVKKTALGLAVSALAALIVLSVIHSVNHLFIKYAAIERTLWADGDPLPPPIPPKPNPPGFTA
jgi:hypothetical protein